MSLVSLCTILKLNIWFVFIYVVSSRAVKSWDWIHEKFLRIKFLLVFDFILILSVIFQIFEKKNVLNKSF